MIFDIVIAAGVLVSCIVAALRGFIREILTILGVVGGGAAAVFAGPSLVPVARGWLGVTPDMQEVPKLLNLVPYTAVADAIAYGGVFIVVVIVLSIISHFLSGWAKTIGLGALDRVLGVAFGFLRAALFFSLMYLPIYLFVDQETRNGWFSGSYAMPYVELSARWVEKALPEQTRSDMEARATEIMQNKTQDAIQQKMQEMDLRRQIEKDNPGYEDPQRDDMRNMIDREGAP